MIPVRLKMRNFMCYRENVPPLNFEGIHIACLSGDNGNGKSALIDAMTWALWGKARAGSDDDLVHAGQPDMEVEFDFAVEQQSYRIIRKRSRPKKQGGAGQSLLEFQIASNGDFRSITGNSLTQTQQKITDVLHMDYDTFVNSAFLRQGHADEFTIKRPAERKQVLANILGLSFYDRLEEQARLLARQHEDEKGKLETVLQEISDELAEKPAYEAEFEEAQRVLDGIEKLMAETDASLSELRREKETLARKTAQFDQLETSIPERQQRLESLDGQIKQHRSRIEEYERLIARRTLIEEGFTRFGEARKTNEELGQKAMRFNNLKGRQGQLEKVIFAAQENLKTDHKIRENKINQLEAEAQKLPQLKSRWQQMQAEMTKLASREDGLRE
ncbi:MAG: SMC family ATPase, partial [Chloroflexi bacterium]|nr:SMC family ATPase [Chloroflexota bacterium]